MTVRNPLILLLFLPALSAFLSAQTVPPPETVFGFTDFSAQAKLEEKFLAVPDAVLAGQHLKTLTAQPHLAATPEDRKTAEYVAQKFRSAGLDTEIVPYRVLMNQPHVVRVEAYNAAGKLILRGPTAEHVEGDTFQDNPHVAMPFNGSSASGEVTGEVVYANYGRLEDFDQLAALRIEVRGKIVLCRYGANFRGVKVFLAQQRGAAAVLIYSDPQDDGYTKGDPYPNGPWRPATGVQRGSVQYMFEYPGDPETPGIASTLDLPDSARTPPDKAASQPHLISIPLSYQDAQPILQALKGPAVPQSWQGALPFHYHVGPSGVKVHLVSDQDYQRRIIWNVIGTLKGSQYPDEWVVAGNHRDAWVYGAVDPSSGTAAMLEAVHGVGTLVHQGWRPKRTLIFASWDAEEEGLIGSTEWVEQHAAELEHAVAYFNTDVAVAGSDFSASAVPSLKKFIREITHDVPSPLGGTVYQQWRVKSAGETGHHAGNAPVISGEEVPIGDLGSGSDFSAFLQHIGVPSIDISSEGPYGVYHSVFDNYAWFTQNADPHFAYLQQMARVFGLEALRMADADVLPYDYVTYAREITAYLEAAKHKADEAKLEGLDFAPALTAARRFTVAAHRAYTLQTAPPADPSNLNTALRQTEAALISPEGLPHRPWFRHTIYAPGEYTGYAVVVLPGVNEALDSKDSARAAQQLNVLTQALDRAANVCGATDVSHGPR